ncbi:CASC3/Barentsz eIF4AIII binding domain containing protein [Naviculisporaceae sp. PSN 640]
MAHAAPRRRKIIGHRRRVDEADDDVTHEHLDIDDDSFSDGSIGSDDNDPGDDSDTSNVDETSPTSPGAKKLGQNGAAKQGVRRGPGNGSATKPIQAVVTDTEIMMERMSIADNNTTAEEVDLEDHKRETSAKDAAPVVVSSNSVAREQREAPRPSVQDPKRREHDEYRRKRDEDPTFIPNRGAFFMHDHRHPGPAANGFRPFPKGARGRGRGFFGGPFAPMNQFAGPSDPTTSAPWTHDMHEQVAAPPPQHHRQGRYAGDRDHEGPANGNGIIPTAPSSGTKINREMSCEKHSANVTVRVFISPGMTPKLFPGVPVKQYTKLPDHRPPLRRDKPVRISLPYHNSPIMPRYIFPADDRSFIFIPRAMRPNQKPLRGKGARSVLGSVGGFSRRTSVWGGSYYGSAYSPSIALSRRSSIAPDIGREFILSPTGSAISRPPLPSDNTRPVVRLPPQGQAPMGVAPMPGPPDMLERGPVSAGEASINDFPQPQTHPLPQKPTFQENRPNPPIPMHQPRPQKTVSVENIEPPVQALTAPPPYQPQAFHHQVPPQMQTNLAQDSHARNLSYPSQISSQAPLSQIPERAMYAPPFQPSTYTQPGYYNQQYPAMQPQQGYYHPQTFPANVAPNANAPAFVPASQPGQAMPYTHPPPQGETSTVQPAAPAQGLVAQEMNGMVYYYDASQLPPMAGFPSYPTTQPYAPGVAGMGGMVTPSPDTYFYQQQPAQGMMYYSQ